MPFPVARLFYAFAFALIAGFVVNLIFALAVVHSLSSHSPDGSTMN